MPRGLAPVLLVLASIAGGCNLYFGSPTSQPPPGDRADAQPPPAADAIPPWPWPDAPTAPDARPSSYTFATCRGGVVYRSAPQPSDVLPPELGKGGTAVVKCSSRCRAADEFYDCLGDESCASASTWLCEPDPYCPVDGACSGTATRTCTQAGACDEHNVATEQCACTSSAVVCTNPCTDGLCTPIQVLEKLRGHWRGTVTPPSFSEPYQVDLIIGADGHLNPHRSDGGFGPAFYYGEDGPDRNRYFNVLGMTPTGAVGMVGVMFDPSEILPGLVDGLHVDAAHLEFTFWDSWLDCSRPFKFELSRVVP